MKGVAPLLRNIASCSSWNTASQVSSLSVRAAVMNSEVISRLESRAKQADEAIAWLKAQIADLQSASQSAELQKLLQENKQLQGEVQQWTRALCQAEEKNGTKQVPIPGAKAASAPRDAPAAKAPATKTPAPEPTPSAASVPPPEKKAAKKNKPKASGDSKGAAPPAAEEPVDIGLLDMRVGRIVSAEKHPDADSLYVEQVDVGEPQPRTVVSGLVKFIPVDQMQNRMAVLLCNLKPAKMRGVTSQAMVMCASTPEKVEILAPPEGAQPGDVVTCPGFASRCPAQLNPKKKIFEQVAPELKTDGELRATYRGVVWEVTGKGTVTTQSLANVQIK